MTNDLRLYAACEALWRDAKYAAMRRSYASVQELQKQLQSSRSSAIEIEQWLSRLSDVYRAPVDEGADRNALFHVMGYFKRLWTQEERRLYHEEARQSPAKMWSVLEQSLMRFPNPYLCTSYVWRDDPWDKVWFRFRKQWLLFSLKPAPMFRTLEDWIMEYGLHHDTSTWVENRFAVSLDGHFMPYEPLWSMVQDRGGGVKSPIQ